MTCGIYILKFSGTDQVYVGQSENIEYRFKKHIQALKRGTHNYKMQAAFHSYGEPSLDIILDSLSKDELNTYELEAFNIFDSINSGFNVASNPSIHGSGELNPASKYTNSDIEKAFFMLLEVNNRYKDIEKATGVSLSTVRHIANSESHLWLKTKYPSEYSILENLKGTTRMQATNSASARGIVYPEILSPTGKVFTVTNVAQFAREHMLDPSSLAKVLKRTPKYNSHKGWKLYNGTHSNTSA